MSSSRCEQVASDPIPGGIRLRGVEHFASPFDRSVTAEARQDGSVSLINAGLDLNMPASAARALGEALIGAAAQAEVVKNSDGVA